MECIVASYFQEVYTKDPTLTPEMVLECIVTKVAPEMNTRLCAPYSDKELSDALFQIGPLKAPGTDGFPMHFYQHNWALLKAKIIIVVLVTVLCRRVSMIWLSF